MEAVNAGFTFRASVWTREDDVCVSVRVCKKKVTKGLKSEDNLEITLLQKTTQTEKRRNIALKLNRNKSQKNILKVFILLSKSDLIEWKEKLTCVFKEMW